jgi:hypothetical protein
LDNLSGLLEEESYSCASNFIADFDRFLLSGFGSVSSRVKVWRITGLSCFGCLCAEVIVYSKWDAAILTGIVRSVPRGKGCSLCVLSKVPFKFLPEIRLLV